MATARRSHAKNILESRGGRTVFVLPPVGELAPMNNQITHQKGGKLEQLNEELQAWIVEMAMKFHLGDTVLMLKEKGIDVSVPTLSRFVRKHREKQLMEDGEEMKEGVTRLAKRG